MTHHQNKSTRFVLAGTVVMFIIVGFIVRPARAEDTDDPRPVAVAAMQGWLHEIDQDQYGQSWQEASPSFQKAITSDQWEAALNSARRPLGKCIDRTLASALRQTEVQSSTGTLKGDFVVAQFDSSFENLKYAVETVCFEKDADATWKAAGYFVKPKT
jgi:hypothetical protein